MDHPALLRTVELLTVPLMTRKYAASVGTREGKFTAFSLFVPWEREPEFCISFWQHVLSALFMGKFYWKFAHLQASLIGRVACERKQT